MTSARPSEEQWELFTTLLELSIDDRFELVLVGCSERAVEEAFYWRLEEHCKEEGRPFLAPALGEDPLDWLTDLRGARVEGTGKARVLFLRLPEAKRVFILHRLNENRDNLRREVRGVLCLVGGPDFLRIVPNEAPDLWSVREKTFELASLSLDKAGGQRGAAPIEAPPRRVEPWDSDALLSVSRHDLPSLEGTLRDLQRDEIIVNVKIDAEERWGIAVSEGLSESRYFVIALSPEYVRAVWPTIEPFFDDDKVLLRRTVLLKLHECVVPEPLRSLDIWDWTTEESRAAAYPRLLEVLKRRDRELSEAASHWLTPLEIMALTNLEQTHTFICELNDYPDPVKVKSHVQMSLVDPGKYWDAGKPNLPDWLRGTVERETKRALFDVTYAILCEHFEEKKKAIERAVRGEGERIGYHVRQVITFIDLQFDVLKEPFSLNCRGQFATICTHVLVGLEFACTARIPDPQKIKGLLQRRANVREKMQEGMMAAAAAILRETTPEDFYLYFNYRMDGKPTVAQQLVREIRTVLARDYGASDVQITCKVTEDEILQRLNEFKSKAWEFYFKVVPKVGHIQVGFKVTLGGIDMLPHLAAWALFAQRLPTGERLMIELTAYLEAKLNEERGDVLISSESKEVSRKIQNWLDGWLKEEYGLRATVTQLQLANVIEGKTPRDLKRLLIEQGHALGQASVTQVAMVTDGRRGMMDGRKGMLVSDINELRATRDELMATLRKALLRGLQGEIDEIKHRIKELDEQIDRKFEELGNVYKDLVPPLAEHSPPTVPNGGTGHKPVK